MVSHGVFGVLIALGIVITAPGAASAADDNVKQAAVEGAKTSLPVPRFVSLKSDKVNVRKGPSTDQSIVWVFSRAGLPVEVIAESDNWRRVRDSEGADGWVFHSLLSARRTVLVAPWVEDYSGYAQQDQLWGVYRGEEIK
jgi:SH3-like domain-containing protein